MIIPIWKQSRKEPLKFEETEVSEQKTENIDHLKSDNPSDEIVKIVNEKYGSQAQKVIVLLAQYGSKSYHVERERVQRAIIKLAKNNIGKLQRLVDFALEDYRDILMWIAIDENGEIPLLIDVHRNNDIVLPPKIPENIKKSIVTLTVESEDSSCHTSVINPMLDNIVNHVKRLS